MFEVVAVLCVLQTNQCIPVEDIKPVKYETETECVNALNTGGYTFRIHVKGVARLEQGLVVMAGCVNSNEIISD